MKVHVSADLPYSVILGQDWPYFPKFLQKLSLAQELEEGTPKEVLGVLFPFKVLDLLTFRPKESKSQKEK